MKKLLFHLLLIAALIVSLSACSNMNSSKTAEKDVKKSITQEFGAADDTISAGAALPAELPDETVSQETTPPNSEVPTSEAPATELPEAVTSNTESSETEAPELPESETTSETIASPNVSDIDVDLTTLSSTMVYAEVYNMMINPNDYIGKTVKMRGAFGIGYSCKEDGTMDENTLVYACVIADATACCSQGIEFILSGEHTYPDDYPELGSEITVVGTFATYEEYSMLFCTLTDAVMEG